MNKEYDDNDDEKSEYERISFNIKNEEDAKRILYDESIPMSNIHRTVDSEKQYYYRIIHFDIKNLEVKNDKNEMVYHVSPGFTYHKGLVTKVKFYSLDFARVSSHDLEKALNRFLELVRKNSLNTSRKLWNTRLLNTIINNGDASLWLEKMS